MAVTVYTQDEFQKIDDLDSFKKKFEMIIAAGGAVTDPDGRILLIFRKGKWDLPKGKVENNEPIELCADREVKEETGLTDIILRKPLLVTYHTYSEKGEDILKETHWFLFDAPGKQELFPQEEEGIVRAEWVEKKHLKKYTGNTYQLVRDVLRSAGY